MVCAELPCTNHAKPSLRSGADLKVKLMLDGPFGQNKDYVNSGNYNWEKLWKH
jgi:hypothetical protein